MKPVLYLDNWNRPQPPNRFERLVADHDFDVVRIRADSERLPAHVDFAGALVGPSDAAAYDDTPWIRAEQAYLRQLAAEQVPILGLCFGSQTLAWALLGDGAVYRRPTREQGFGFISLTSSGRTDPLTSSMPARIEAFHWHRDEVITKHPDLILLAAGSDCGNQIWRWRHGPVWGVQPHPEYDAEGFRAWFDSDRSMFLCAGFNTEDGSRSARSCEQAGEIFNNFVNFVKANASIEGRG